MDDELKALLDEYEGSSPEVYKDIKDIPTAGRGINLNVPGTKKMFKKEGLDLDKVKKNEQRMSPEQIESTYNARLAELDSILQSRRNKQFPNAVLAPSQVNALRSLTFNSPKLLGPNLMRNLNKNDYSGAGKEILLRSNRHETPGIQKRRLDEARIFMGADWDDFTANLSDLEKRQVKNGIDQIQNYHTKKLIYDRHPWLVEGASPRFKKMGLP